MPDYNFRAVSKTGDPYKGLIMAPTILKLEEELAKSGSVLIETYGREANGFGKTDINIFGPGVKNSELIDCFLTLKVLLKASVTIIDAFRIINQEIENDLFHGVISEIISSIEAGNFLSDTISEFPKVFSPHMVGMIRAGEQGGNLPEVLEEIVRYLEWQEELKQEVRQATLYPLMVLAGLSIFITVLFTFVVPRFIKLLTSLNVALPFPTRIVMSISELFVSSWWLLVPLAILIPMAIHFGRKRWEWLALSIDRLKLKLPLFGEINNMLAMSKFAFNFATLFKSGVSILQNLELCQELVGNKVVAKALKDSKRDVEGGMTLNDSLRRHDVFSPKALMMITVGESSGTLGPALQNVADFYNKEVPRKIKKIFGIMEPLIMLFLVSIVGFTAAAIILPIVSLFGGVR